MTKFLEERVDELEQEVSELKLIVAQIRKPSTEVSEALAAESVEDNQADTIEFEGNQYKKVDREARAGDVVIFRENTSRCVDNNKKYLAFFNKKGELSVGEGPSSTQLYCVYYKFYNRTIETVDVYELIVEDKTKSPNDLRAEIIEKAKLFVEDGAKEDLSLDRGRGYVVPFEDDRDSGFICELDFVANTEKRTVVAILRWNTPGRSEIKAKGIAKCNPSDVYNESIGKAIALGRALGLDVSEFEQAVQPNAAVTGMMIESLYFGKDYGDPQFRNTKVTGITHDDKPKHDDGYHASHYRILNDTNAIYGGVE